MLEQFDIAIIGSGPAGYIGAIRAAQLGAKVALIEKNSLGGTCLNKGCIPTKALLASAKCIDTIKKSHDFGINIDNYSIDFLKIFKRKDDVVKQISNGLNILFKNQKNIKIFYGEAAFKTANQLEIISDKPLIIEAQNIIIASGSYCGSIPGISTNGHNIFNSDDAVNLKEIPKKLVIIGSGAIGIEWQRIFSSLGSEVTIIEMSDRVTPNCDKEISRFLLTTLKKNKIEVKTSSKVENIENLEGKLKITLNNQEKIETEKIMLAVGRRPKTNIKGIEQLNLEYSKGYIKTNNQMQTNIQNIYAVGDVAGKLQLAHSASTEAISAVENILLSKKKNINYNQIPFCIYGTPEIGSVGLTEDKAIEMGYNIKTKKIFFGANGRAIAESDSNGFVKTIIDKQNNKILGTHIIGPTASDMIHQALISMKANLTRENFEDVTFAHPTFSETFFESIINLHS